MALQPASPRDRMTDDKQLESLIERAHYGTVAEEPVHHGG